MTPRAKTTALPDSSDQVGSDSKGGNPMGSPSLLDPILHPVAVAIRFPNPRVWVWFGFGTLSLGAVQIPRIKNYLFSSAGGGS